MGRNPPLDDCMYDTLAHPPCTRWPVERLDTLRVVSREVHPPATANQELRKVSLITPAPGREKSP